MHSVTVTSNVIILTLIFIQSESLSIIWTLILALILVGFALIGGWIQSRMTRQLTKDYRQQINQIHELEEENRNLFRLNTELEAGLQAALDEIGKLTERLNND